MLVPGLLLTGIGLLAVGVGSCGLLSREGRAVRDRVIPAAHAACDRSIEVNARPFLVSLCQVVLSCIPMDPEARTAVRALRGAEVGVYHPSHPVPSTDRTAALNAADQVMTEWGWTRVVGVQEPDALVAVYAPVTPRSPRNLQLRVLVLQGEQLVLGSARGDVEALATLACAKGGWRKHLELSMLSGAAHRGRR
jgi:hypothetical protein